MPRHDVHHGITMSQGDYGITFVSPDVYTHEIRPAASLAAESTQTVILSAFYRKVDQLGLKDKAVGHSRIEAGMPRRWQMRYSIAPRSGGFDPVADERAGWEACTPMVARMVPAADGAIVLKESVSFLSVDAPGVMAYGLKVSESGDGLILKLREISGTPVTAALSSDLLSFSGAGSVDLVERDTGERLATRNGKTRVRLGANELKNIRLRMEPRKATKGETR